MRGHLFGNHPKSTRLLKMAQPADDASCASGPRLLGKDGYIGWDLIPEPLLLHICSFLGSADKLRVCAVCFRWRNVVTATAGLWTTFDFTHDIFGMAKYDSYFETCMKMYGNHVRTVRMSTAPAVAVQLLQLCAQNCPAIEEVCIAFDVSLRRRYDYMAAVVHKLFRAIARISTLRRVRMPGLAEWVESYPNAQSAPRRESFELRCANITAIDLRRFTCKRVPLRFSGCPNLRRLAVSYHNMDEEGLRDLYKCSLEKISVEVDVIDELMATAWRYLKHAHHGLHWHMMFPRDAGAFWFPDVAVNSVTCEGGIGVMHVLFMVNRKQIPLEQLVCPGSGRKNPKLEGLQRNMLRVLCAVRSCVRLRCLLYGDDILVSTLLAIADMYRDLDKLYIRRGAVVFRNDPDISEVPGFPAAILNMIRTTEVTSMDDLEHRVSRLMGRRWVTVPDGCWEETVRVVGDPL
ncbi:uncharacterized protein LOC144917160 isoform X2 [Branchiostoma floridae x Branchiostoma belcheri]